MVAVENTRRSCQAFVVALAVAATLRAASGQSPSRVDYRLTVDSVDHSGIAVEMRIHRAPAEFRLAMAAHPEYDDKYWRYLTDLAGESAQGTVRVTREDSSLWQVASPGGDVTIHYHVRFPASSPIQQAAWKAHLTPTGGLVGGPHSFLYVFGAEHTPVRVTLVLPSTWRVATGLAPETAPLTFSARGAEALVDSPILVGLIRSWPFDIRGVPHNIAYLGNPAGVPFDTAQLVGNVERIAREATRLFGRMPYHRYQFLFEDGTYGGLEHQNSVSMGAQSLNLARDPNSLLGQIAHEFFHTWNEVHVRPASWVGIRHVAPAPTSELWWSEGVTLYFADLLLRHAGLPLPDSTRVQHLATLIGRYLANPSHALVSPEQTSRAFNLPPGTNGDYTPSMYTQGEMLGAMLDLMIREGSKGRHSLDDVMRGLAERFTPEVGFTGNSVEHAVSDACECNAHQFFANHVQASGAINFDRWLGVVGWRTDVTWAAARATDGTPAADVRVSGYDVPGEPQPRLQIWFPATVWGRAGLHTGDRLVSWNGIAVPDAQHLRSVINQLHIGDTARVAVIRDTGFFETTVTLAGYERPAVRIEERPDATDAQRRLRSMWLVRQ